jgi:hypothetical protein
VSIDGDVVFSTVATERPGAATDLAGEVLQHLRRLAEAEVVAPASDVWPQTTKEDRDESN